MRLYGPAGHGDTGVKRVESTVKPDAEDIPRNSPRIAW
jgi:hypothetical protein